MLSSSSPGLNRPSPSCSSINTMWRHSSRNRGFSKWPKTLQQVAEHTHYENIGGETMGEAKSAGKVVCFFTWHSSTCRGPQRAGLNSAHQTLLGQPPAGREEVPWAAGWEDLCGSSGFCWSTKKVFNKFRSARLETKLAHTELKEVMEHTCELCLELWFFCVCAAVVLLLR